MIRIVRAVRPFSFLLLLSLCVGGCGGGSSSTGPGTPPPSYDERITAGWASFAAGDYDAARREFADAIPAEADRLAGYVGLGWSELRRGNADAAHAAFGDGSLRAGPDELRADLEAGWAFAWHARPTASDHYAESNARVAAAEALAPDWSLPADGRWNRDDLRWLAAANHFARGEFAASLLRVQPLDPSFTADVATAAGQAALATRIEELRT